MQIAASKAIEFPLFVSPFELDTSPPLREGEDGSELAGLGARPLQRSGERWFAQQTGEGDLGAQISYPLTYRERSSYTFTVLPSVADLSAASASFSAARPSLPLGEAAWPLLDASMKVAISLAYASI